MDAYIIASAQSGIPDDITSIFPGCSVREWTPLREKLTGKPLQAMQFITEALLTAPWVSHRAVAEGLKMEWSNYRKRVLKSPGWAEAFADTLMEEAVGPRGAKGVRMRQPDMAARAA